MAEVLRMPMMGNTMEVGVVVEWVVSEGEAVSEGDTVVVVESEKAANDVVAEQDGVLVTVEVEEGEEVPPGTELGVIRGAEETDSSAPDSSATESSVTDSSATGDAVEAMADDDDSTAVPDNDEGRIPAAPGARKRAREASVPLDPVDGSGPGGAVLIADLETHLETTEEAATDVAEPHDGFVPAPPRVRRLARELDVDLGELTETTEGRSITTLDVRRAAGMGDTATAGPASPQPAEGRGQIDQFDPASHGLTVVEERQFTGMRRTIARRMSQSAREKPHVTLNRRVDVGRALAVVDEYRDSAVELGFTDLLVCATIEALESHPEFNAWYADETLSLVEEVNVGIAVDIEGGLVTPVLRNGGRKTPAELAEERAELTAAVREGRYDLEDIQGGTFTISNLGMLGVDSFDPIINPPEIAILGVGRIREEDDSPELTLSLSFDHRVVDGADAARFLETLVDGLTSPTVLVGRRTQVALD